MPSPLADASAAAPTPAAQRPSSQERQDLYQIFEQAPAAIVLLREPDHRIEYLNPAFARLFPSTALPGPLTGHTLAEAFPDAVAGGIVAHLDEVYQSGEGYAGNEEALALVAPAGNPAERRYFNFTYQAYREQGRITGVTAFIYDVTEQALLRRQRDAQQRELQRTFEQAPVAIAILRGPELVIELANPAVSAIWGHPATETVGRPYFEAKPDTAGQGFEEILGGVLRTGQPLAITEAPVTLDRAHTGQPRQAYVNFVFQPLFDEHGTATGLIAVGTEVTEQVVARQQVQQLNDTLQATNARLTRTNAELDSFVYAASHDLKAPIANIEGLLDALRQELPAEQLAAPHIAHLLSLMRHSVARFQQTIGHLTRITQVQYATPATADTVDLGQLVADVQLDLAPALQTANAALTVETTNCAQVHFTPQSLRSIVYNLLSNALKYRAPGRRPEIRLAAACAGPELVLSVQDNGLGLTPEQQAKLFRLFQRLHTHIEGSGVGLYTIKKIVEAAGGSIGVASEPGVGSTFTVRLPNQG